MSKVVLILIGLLSLSGCCLKCEPDCCKPDLGSLQKLSYGTFSRSKVTAMRSASLRDAALSMGARGGLACRAQQINCILLKHEALLYRLFNFNAIMLDKSVLPPVLLEGRNTLRLSGCDAIRISDRTYQIIKQACFVTAPPIWRDYLWMTYTSPEVPERALLPRTRTERMLWKRFVSEGWRAGIQQADLIFRENLGRLKRDFEGMLRYRTLLAQNMVSPPFVAEMEMGVTGGGSDMTVNDRVLRITALPALQSDSRNWKTQVIPLECQNQ